MLSKYYFGVERNALNQSLLKITGLTKILFVHQIDHDNLNHIFKLISLLFMEISMKLLKISLMMLGCLSLLVGCASTPDDVDAEKVVAEKSAKSTTTVKKSLLAETISAGTSYVVREEVAKRQAAFSANEDDFLESESKRIFQLVREMKTINADTKQGVKKSRKRNNKKKNTTQSLVASEGITQYSEALKVLNALDNEVKTSETLLENVRKSVTPANKKKFKGWELRLDALRNERMQFEQFAIQLYNARK
jgi:hypothetical protein